MEAGGAHPASPDGGFPVQGRCTKGVLGPALQDGATGDWSSSCRPFPAACCLPEHSVPQFPSRVGRRNIPWASRRGGCALQEEGWRRAHCSWETWGKAERSDVTDSRMLQAVTDGGWWYLWCCWPCGMVRLWESTIPVPPLPSPLLPASPGQASFQLNIPLTEHPPD